MRAVKVTLTLPEATHVELLLGQLADHVDEERAGLYRTVAGALDVELRKAGCTKTDDGWLYPRM